MRILHLETPVPFLSDRRCPRGTRVANQSTLGCPEAAHSPKVRMEPSRNIDRLIEIMAALRTPGSGCPWDLEQDFESIVPYTIEEAYEVADAIERGDLVDLKDELGDLL